MMRSLRDLKGATLTWEQPHALRREYELRSSNDLFATLRTAGPGGGRAFAESAEGGWTMHRHGFPRARYEVQDAHSDAAIATFRNGWGGGGWLELPGGERFRWRPANFWRTRWQFEREGGTPVVRFAGRPAFLRGRAGVEIEPGAESSPETPLLVTLGWYLMRQAARHHRGH